MHRISTAIAALAVIATSMAPAVSGQARVLTLQEAIAIGQHDGYQSRVAQASLEASQFRSRAFRSRLLPQLSLNGTVPSYNRSIIEVQQPDGSSLFRPRNQTNANLNLQLSQRLPILGGDLFVSSSLARVAISGSQALETWSSTPFQVGLRQEIFRPNNLEWDRQEQGLQSDAAERQWLESREDVALTVTGLFYDVYAARMTLQNALTNVAVNDTLYRINNGRYEVGRIGENDLLQSELALLRSRTTADGARLEYDRAVAALRLELNLPDGMPLEVVVTPEVPVLEVDTLVAVQQALANRAAVTEAELQGVQARRAVNAAKLSGGPGATITASYGLNSAGDQFRTAYDGLQEARQFSLGVQMPLWQWGARDETVAAARADEARTTAQREQTMEQVAQDAHFAALQLLQARRALELSAKADTVAGKRFEVAYNRYVIGRITIDNLYQAQAEKDQALLQYVQAQRSYWQAYYRLRRLTLFDFERNTAIR